MRTSSHRQALLGAATILAIVGRSATSFAQAGDAGSGTLRVQVVNTMGAPVPYADVTIASQRFSAFTDSIGGLTIRHLPSGTLTLQVRRIGLRASAVTVSVVPERVTPVRVALENISLRLAAVRVSGDLCPGAHQGDTAVVAILGQLRANAERYRLLADAYPFLVKVERVYGNRGYMQGYWSPRTGAKEFVRQVLRRDTVELAGRSEWRYAPGKLIVPVTERIEHLPRVFEKLIVPQLADFADSAFVAAHCFRYAGLDRIDSTLTVARVDFSPARFVRTPDVSGSIYLDTATYQILKSRLQTQRPSPAAPMSDTWRVQVDTWFAEFLPGIPIIDEIASSVTMSSAAASRRLPGAAATEYHRRLSVRFLRAFPGVLADPLPAPIAVARDVEVVLACETGGDVSALASRPSPLDSVTMTADGATVKVCYSRPVANERSPYDSLAPFGREWRTGAHEPTTLRLNAELEVAGVVLAPGRYVMHTIPDSTEWRVIFYTATGTTTAQMFASLREVGRGTASVQRLPSFVSRFTIREDSGTDEPALLLEWGELRARIPIWTRR